MRAAAAQRILVLAAVAVLGALVAIATVEARARDTSDTDQVGAVAPGGWYAALAASRGTPADAERTTCGLLLTSRSYGVTHPVLPCGTKVLLRYGGVTVLSSVIDNQLDVQGRQVEVTERLAGLLGLSGTQQLEWRFATAADTGDAPIETSG